MVYLQALGMLCQSPMSSHQLDRESSLAVVCTVLHEPSVSWFRCFCAGVTLHAHLWLLNIEFEDSSGLDCRQSKSLVETALYQIIFAVSLNIKKKRD